MDSELKIKNKEKKHLIVFIMLHNSSDFDQLVDMHISLLYMLLPHCLVFLGDAQTSHDTIGQRKYQQIRVSQGAKTRVGPVFLQTQGL